MASTSTSKRGDVSGAGVVRELEVETMSGLELVSGRGEECRHGIDDLEDDKAMLADNLGIGIHGLEELHEDSLA